MENINLEQIQKELIIVHWKRLENKKEIIQWVVVGNWEQANNLIEELNSIPKDEEDEKLFNKTCCIHTFKIQQIIENEEIIEHLSQSNS